MRKKIGDNTKHKEIKSFIVNNIENDAALNIKGGY